ncbi:MAG: bifunctional DNA primase/polymerase [Phycisphaeraceae bacterium]|nr:bifunctional DNA primase/polymerase [Phycisphaeraceae bacterium]
MSDPTPLDHARALLARGLAPIPVRSRSKKPTLKGWPSLRLTTDTLPAYFKRAEGNVGVAFGEPSGGVVDVDLDHPRALELADSFLPHTGLTWGRASKPRSHRLYRLTAPHATRKWTRKPFGMIVELRSTGCQTIAPGSIHPSGEPIRWDDEGEPALIHPDELVRAIGELVVAVVGVGVEAAVVEAKANTKPTSDDPSIPVDPIRPKDPVDPIRMTPEQVIESAKVDGPHLHDPMTLRLARGLKLNARVPSIEAAQVHFDAWWAKSRPHCSDQDTEAARFKFERAFLSARDPLGSPGVAASVLASVNELPSALASKPFGMPLARFVDALAEMGRRSEGTPFALSARMVARAFGVSDSVAHEWMKGLERRGLIRTTDRGRAGANGTGKARRIMVLPHVWNAASSD